MTVVPNNSKLLKPQADQTRIRIQNPHDPIADIKTSVGANFINTYSEMTLFVQESFFPVAKTVTLQLVGKGRCISL